MQGNRSCTGEKLVGTDSRHPESGTTINHGGGRGCVEERRGRITDDRTKAENFGSARCRIGGEFGRVSPWSSAYES
jgi:hypothetical protein